MRQSSTQLTWTPSRGWAAPLLPIVEFAAPKSQTISPNLHVLIASVPWRRVSLNRLIHNVAKQTLLPSTVHLVLDGDGEPSAELDASPLERVGVKIDIREQHPSRGAGSRWVVLDALADDDVVCNFDDDVGVRSNDYLAQHYTALQKCSAVTAGGHLPMGGFLSSNEGSDYTGPILCLQTGAFSVRVKALRGLRDMPLAKEMLGVGGDDEGLIAAHLWRQSVQVQRINTPVGFDPCSGDARAQFRNNPQRVTTFRNCLKSLIGWKWR